ncbi:MAG: YkoP family protein [Wenzhouxiangella sp.]
MKRWLWRPINLAMRGIESIYQRAHGLEPVGPLLYVRKTRYSGPVRELADGTQLRRGEPVGELHFNNRGLEQAQRGGGHHGFVFARLMLQALASLAQAARQDAGLKSVTGFHGVTWIRPHGNRVGFEARQLPSGWRTWLLGWYFRLVLYAFNPSSLRETDRQSDRQTGRHKASQSSRRVARRLEVYEFWLSREQLLEKFDR